jgi:hypothetical protein
MITGVHALIFSPEAEAVRTFLRDKVGLSAVDAGGGWLIFALPPAELGVHPDQGHRHELYLMCDDIEKTVDELNAKGVEFKGPISEEGFGRVAVIRMPGGGELAVYQPKHPTALPD